MAIQYSYDYVTWSAATSTTFSYEDPCPNAGWNYAPVFNTLTINARSIGVTNTISVWKDSVTASKNNGTIICAYTMSFWVNTAPSPAANSTFYTKLSYATTSTTSTAGT